MQKDDSAKTPTEPAARRSFIVRLTAVVTGTIVALFPFVAGWGVITNPLRRPSGSSDNDDDLSKFSRICPLDALPADGIPREFAIVAVFLARSSKNPNEVTAFTATCPHLGCAVEFDGAKKEYECPCHKSGFAIDGKKLFGPSRRGLDPLPVKLADNAGGKEILVKFER